MRTPAFAIAMLLSLAACRGSDHAGAPTSDTPRAATVAKAEAPQDADALRRDLLHARAFEAVVWGMPAVNYELMRREMETKTKGKVGEFIYWGKPMDWHNQTLTPNPDTLYFMVFLDLGKGPMVLEIPPADGGAVNANMVTGWQMPLEDGGLLGVDKGAGGKFLFLPPGWTGTLPAGYEPLQSDTNGMYVLMRSNLKSRADADVAASVAYGKRAKVYPLSAAANPPATVFTDVAGLDFDSTIRYDASFFDLLDRFVQENPWIDRDRAMIDSLASLGIVRGKKFAPDAATRDILAKAASDAHAYLEAMYDKGWPAFFDGTQWRGAAHPGLVKSMQSGYTVADEYPIELRGMAYSYAYVGIKRLGTGQFYLLAIKDKGGMALDGGKSYRLHVPPNVPVKQYWSVTAYDRRTHALIKNVDRASRASNAADVQANPDGSVDVWIGPKPPAGKESNWLPTDPKREFELLFRLYGPTQGLFDKAWTLPDVEPAT